MQDLTKILKVGDPVWSLLYGEGVVSIVEAGVNLPFAIEFKADDAPFGRWFDKCGRGTVGGLPQLYPLDQRPEIPAPQWPEVFEIQGEVYKKGEWVAVSDYGEFWQMGQLARYKEGNIITRSANYPLSMRNKAHLERLIRVLQKSVERNKYNAMLRRSDLKLIARYRAEIKAISRCDTSTRSKSFHSSGSIIQAKAQSGVPSN